MRRWNGPTAGQAATRKWPPCWGSTWWNSTPGSRRCGGSSLGSLEAPGLGTPDGDAFTLHDLVATDAAQGPEARVQAQQRTALLAEAIEALPQQEKVVIALYYHEELTMKEIGQVLDVTESRVSQIHTKAIFHLRSMLTVLLDA